MYGDYEAQRHWMEVTLNLPAQDWYVNTTHNDLSYWGLDYPPLSAYASALLGAYVRYIDQDAMRLYTSRGYESSRSRSAMRATVIFADVILFLPAVALIAHQLYPNDLKRNRAILVFTLTLPSLLLVDHAHFQYNGVGAAFFLLAVFAFSRHCDAWGAAMFCASIYFKQTSLYYGLPVASFLVCRLFRRLRSSGTGDATVYATKIIASIVVTTACTFAPWLSSRGALYSVFKRLFPVERGLFEDKVANFWCTLSVIIRPKPVDVFTSSQLMRICAALTIISTLPFCIAVLLKPSTVRLLLACCGSALSAFLFSYQVHEKQILLAVVPFAVLHAHYPYSSTWFSVVACSSLFPLIYREGSTVAYFAVIILHIACIYPFYPRRVRWRCCDWIAYCSIPIFIILHGVLIIGKPPANLPHLFIIMTTSFACLHFCLIYLLLIYFIFKN